MYNSIYGENVFFKTTPLFSRKNFSKKVRDDWQVPIVISEYSKSISSSSSDTIVPNKEWYLSLSPENSFSVVYAFLENVLSLGWNEGVVVFIENEQENTYYRPNISCNIGKLYKKYHNPFDFIIYMSFIKKQWI
jgi:hypothetical protein